MSALTDIAENRVLNELFGGASFAIPGTWYLGLLTAAPSDNTSGTEVTSAGSNYSRVAVLNTTAQWNDASGGVKTNSTIISFSSAAAAWGTVGWVGFYDSSAANATLWVWSALTVSKSIQTGDQPRFASGDISIAAS